MMTPDDERTLQVLDAVDHGFDSRIVGVADFSRLYEYGFIRRCGVLSDAGRAKLDELREKKGRGE